jgi:hypothetical protein
LLTEADPNNQLMIAEAIRQVCLDEAPSLLPLPFLDWHSSDVEQIRELATSKNARVTWLG